MEYDEAKDGEGAAVANPFTDGERSKPVVFVNNRQSLGVDDLASAESITH